MASRHPKTGRTWAQQEQQRHQEIAYGRRWLGELLLLQGNREAQQRQLLSPGLHRSLLQHRSH